LKGCTGCSQCGTHKKSKGDARQAQIGNDRTLDRRQAAVDLARCDPVEGFDQDRARGQIGLADQ